MVGGLRSSEAADGACLTQIQVLYCLKLYVEIRNVLQGVLETSICRNGSLKCAAMVVLQVAIGPTVKISDRYLVMTINTT
jgi:hypothetical protein